MPIQTTSFGWTPEGQEASLFTLTNGQGAQVSITNLGATIVSIRVPDCEGHLADVVLGFDSVENYCKPGPYFGAIVGRHANRIEKGRFALNGKTYALAVNNGPNHIHGGLRGFDKVLWHATILPGERPGLRLSYLSPHGEENYPGNLTVEVIYTLDDDNTLSLSYWAQSDQDTVLNLTNHSYFNLNGENQGSILQHQLQIHAHAFTLIDDTGLPTGVISPVDGSPMDFRQPRTIGEAMDWKNPQINAGKGYDHNWILEKKYTTMPLAATLSSPQSGRILEVYTTKPGLQFYSGNFLDNHLLGKGQKPYSQHSGCCLETQYFPNAMQHRHFPSPILRSAEVYRHTTLFRFRTSAAAQSRM